MKKTYLLLVFLFASVLMVNSQPIPVAYYSFTGNANDAGSSAINGTAYGNPTLTSDNNGIDNSAFLFDGIDDYIDLGSSLVLKPNSQVSLALWADNDNWTSFSSWAALAGNTASGGYELIIHGSTGNLESQCKRNGTYGITTYALSNLSSGWHHFAFSFDGRYNILYVDGIAVDTDDAGAIYPVGYGNPGNSTIIGDEAGTGSIPEGDRFSGKIDEVRFYDVALTAGEILTIFNSSIGIKDTDPDLNSKVVYPNPATDRITIAAPDQNGWHVVSINDLSGKTIDRKMLKANSGKLIYSRPSQVDAGFYLLNIEEDSGIISSHKVVFK